MDPLSQWFQQAAGFSGERLSLFIRSLIFFLAVIWGAFITKGSLAHLHEAEDPMGEFVKLILVGMLLVAIWVMVY